MATPANYQRSGTEPLRSNQQIKRSDTLNPGLDASGKPTGGRKVSEATTLRSTDLKSGLGTSGKPTGGLNAYDSALRSTNLKQSAGGNKDVWPAKVDSFDDAET